MPSRILDPRTTVTLQRETEGQFRERTDIKVEAPLVFGGVGQVIIEVKWSDNVDKKHNVSTGLKQQLGDRYLIGDGKTHGTFLVGWNGLCGQWRKRAGARPRSNSPEDWESALQQQAADYAAENEGIRIIPVVLPLEWPKNRS